MINMKLWITFFTFFSTAIKLSDHQHQRGDDISVPCVSSALIPSSCGIVDDTTEPKQFRPRHHYLEKAQQMNGSSQNTGRNMRNYKWNKQFTNTKKKKKNHNVMSPVFPTQCLSYILDSTYFNDNLTSPNVMLTVCSTLDSLRAPSHL